MESQTLACLALQPVLVKLAGLFPSIHWYAYLDDLVVVGLPMDLEVAEQALQDGLQQIGLKLNLEKRFSSTSLPGALCCVEVCPGKNVLGVPFNPFRDLGTIKAVQKVYDALALIISGVKVLTVQVALLLAHHVVNGRLSYAMRLMPSVCMLDTMHEVDSHAVCLLKQLLGLADLPEGSWRQFFLPLGPGLGFHSAVRTALPAYASSWCRFLHGAAALGMSQVVEQLESSDHPLAACHQQAKQFVGNVLKSNQPVEELDVFHLQSRITSKLLKQEEETFMHDPCLLLCDKVRLVSASQENAVAWLHAIPSAAELTMPDEDFSLAVRLLLVWAQGQCQVCLWSCIGSTWNSFDSLHSQAWKFWSS